MSNVIFQIIMSLDGYINDSRGSVKSLYPDYKRYRNSSLVEESIKNTGAVLMGRKTFEMGNPDSYADDYEYQVPIFVLTNHAPEVKPKESGKLTFTFLNGSIEEAILAVRKAAGDNDITIVGGASLLQQCLNAGVCNEILIGIMPVLLGNGLRLFENITAKHLRLENVRTIKSAGIMFIKGSINYKDFSNIK
jgi:dihydrofolate reductase